jgi:hypothetical protein
MGFGAGFLLLTVSLTASDTSGEWRIASVRDSSEVPRL